MTRYTYDDGATSETMKLLSAAFPATEGDRMGWCAWCGAARNRSHALCRSCWASLSEAERTEYMLLDIVGRAIWIARQCCYDAGKGVRVSEAVP